MEPLTPASAPPPPPALPSPPPPPPATDPVAEEAERIAKEWAKGMTRAALLARLERGESYGYEIVTSLRDQGVRFLASNEAAIYPILRDLEERGHLRSRWVATEAGVPPRKYYALSGDGARLLAALRHTWKKFAHEIRHALEAP